MEECKKRPVCIPEPCHGMVWYEAARPVWYDGPVHGMVSIY